MENRLKMRDRGEEKISTLAWRGKLQVWNLSRDHRDTLARWISRDDTIPIPTANQPTEDEDEGGGGEGGSAT